MKTIATINFKGGVGKTTCTWALGYVAAHPSKKRCSLSLVGFESAAN
jgi:cellulose biosynthesis protein BcsQ